MQRSFIGKLGKVPFQLSSRLSKKTLKGFGTAFGVRKRIITKRHHGLKGKKIECQEKNNRNGKQSL